MNGRLITFSGSDCTGKSTQIELLRAELVRRGMPVTTLWFRPGYSRLMDGARRLVRRVRPSALPGPANVEARQRAFARPGVKRSWVAVALLDMFIQYGLVVRSHLLRGRTVICDRYFADARLDLELRFPDVYPRVVSTLTLCELSAPRPDHAFLITVPDDELARRALLKAEPFADSPDLRRTRNQAYTALAATGAFSVLDGSRSRESVRWDVMKAVNRDAPR